MRGIWNEIVLNLCLVRLHHVTTSHVTHLTAAVEGGEPKAAAAEEGAEGAAAEAPAS